MARVLPILAALLAVALPAAPAAGAGTPRCFGAASRDAARPCANEALARKATPKPQDAPLTPNAACTPIRSKRAPKTCWFGAKRKGSAGAIALVGDSHAPAWRATLAPIARAKRWHAYTVFRSSCPFTALRPLPRPATASSCEPFLRATGRWFARHPEVHTVFLGLSAAYDYGETSYEAGVAGVREQLRSLPPTVKRIVVLRDSPRAQESTLACVERALRRGDVPGTACRLDRTSSLLPDAAATAAEQEAAEQPAGRVQVIDLSSAFCDDAFCFPVIGGALVFKDVSHMTATFATTLAPQLRRRLAALPPR